MKLTTRTPFRGPRHFLCTAMSFTVSFRSAAALLLLLAAVPVAAQAPAVPAPAAALSAGESHPATAVVREYLNFVLQREWGKSADLVEPKSLDSLQKDYMERVRRAQTMDEEEMMFRRVGKSTMEDLVAMAPKDFYMAYHKGLQERMQIDEAALERVKKSLQMKVLSVAEEGDSRVHVLVRTKHANDKIQVENLELISLLKTGGKWLVGLNEQMPKVTGLDGKPLNGPGASEAPVKPAAAPVKPAAAPAKPAAKPKAR
jgi:hypothetical protein